MLEKFRGPDDYIGVRHECGCWALASGQHEVCPKHHPQDLRAASFEAHQKWATALVQQAKDAHTEEAKLKFFRFLTEEPAKKENDPEDDL